MFPLPPACRALALLLAATIAPAGLASTSPAHAHAEPTPPFAPPEGRRVETRLDPWEARTAVVERFLKRTLCPALKEHGVAAARLFASPAELTLPLEAETPARIDLLGLQGTRLAPGPTRTIEGVAIARALEAWLAPHVERLRCSVGFHTSVIFRGKPFLAQGSFHLIFGSRDGEGHPVQDSLEARFELSGPRGALRLTRFALGTIHRVRADAVRYIDVTAAAGLPTTFREDNSDLTLDGPDRGSIAITDLDGDGWLDLYTGRAGKNLLFVNQGDGTFKERASTYGVDDAGSARAMLFADLDGDGDEDLVVANAVQLRRRGGITVYAREGHRFRKVFHLSRGKNDAYRAMAAGDIDGDGDLDLHLCNYGRPDLKQGTPSFLDNHSGASNLLLINSSEGGHWRFEDRAKAWGVRGDGWSYASVLVDLDQDGRLDLVVADDFGRKRVYRNVDGTHFEDRSVAAGPGRERAAGMGIDVADVNEDGFLDLYFANMHSNSGTRLGNFLPPGAAVTSRIGRAAAGNTLWLGGPDLTFSEAGVPWGVADGGWAWGVRFLEIDLAGPLELASPCGFITGPELRDG